MDSAVSRTLSGFQSEVMSASDMWSGRVSPTLRGLGWLGVCSPGWRGGGAQSCLVYLNRFSRPMNSKL